MIDVCAMSLGRIGEWDAYTSLNYHGRFKVIHAKASNDNGSVCEYTYFRDDDELHLRVAGKERLNEAERDCLQAKLRDILEEAERNYVPTVVYPLPKRKKRGA